MSGSTLGAAGLLGLPVGRYLQPLDESGRNAVASLHRDELGPWEGRLVLLGERPAIVLHTDEGFRALSAVCTHLGCIVKWQKSRRQFFCPCHGARFDAKGQVLGGPATGPLAEHEVEEIDDLLTIRRA